MDRLATDAGYRHSIDRRLRAAGRLIQAAAIELESYAAPDLASEFARRDLDLLCRALESLIAEVRGKLSKMSCGVKLREDACPHCGWKLPPNERGECFRCGQLREAYRDAARRAPRGVAEGSFRHRLR